MKNIRFAYLHIHNSNTIHIHAFEFKSQGKTITTKKHKPVRKCATNDQ